MRQKDARELSSQKMNTKFLLNKLTEGNNLSQTEASNLLEKIIAGELNSAQIAAVLIALKTKGETVDEIVGFIKTMRKHMVKIKAPRAVDIVGTGGDGVGTFNISTTSSFVVAGCGIPVAKHGNRAASSKCGSADVLENLGVNLNLTPTEMGEVFKKTDIVFLFAPFFHPAMKTVAPIRKELGIRTIFNFLGPFLNPATTKRQLLGVTSIKIAQKLAKVAAKLNFAHLLLVTSEDGMDEITTTAKTKVFEIKSSQIRSYFISPEKYKFKIAKKSDLLGLDAPTNAAILLKILRGEKGPKRDIVLLNSAAALLVSGKVKNIGSGVILAEKSIDSGSALQALQKLITESNKYAK